MGDFRGGFMMVGHDDVNSVLHHFLDLFGGGDAAVDCDEKRTAVLDGHLQSIAHQAFFEQSPVGYVDKDFSSNVAQKFGQKDGSGHSVDVIVAVDEDVLVVVQSGKNPLDRLVHFGEKFRVVEIREFGVEKFVDFRKGFKPARDENLGNDRMDIELGDNRIEKGRVPFRIDPKGMIRFRSCRMHRNLLVESPIQGKPFFFPPMKI